MKIMLLVAFFVFLVSESFSQTNPVQLAVEIKNTDTNTTDLLVFKPNKRLKIKTSEGITYTSEQYIFSEKFMVVNCRDTIGYDQIDWIQGKVFKNADRKIFGVLITAIAAPFIAFCILDTAVEGGPEIILAIPFIAMARGGIRMAGARKFHLSPNCRIKLIEQKIS